MSRYIVDRVYELGIFSSCINNENMLQTSSIILIEDVSGQGKTKLLEKYHRYCNENGLLKSHVDLKANSLTPIDILDTICKDICPIELNQCKDILRNPYKVSPSYQISGNKSIGRTDISICTDIQLTGLSPEDRKQWWAASSQAFFDDFLNFQKKTPKILILLFDTFDKADPDTQKWISDSILRMATPERIPGLFVVIAGKKLPDPLGEWEQYSTKLTLEPLKLEDWRCYAQLVHSTLNENQIEQLYSKHKSNPIKMAETIDVFTEKRQS